MTIPNIKCKFKELQKNKKCAEIEKNAPNVTVNLSDLEEKIIKIIEDNPKTNIEEISIRLNRTTRTIKRAINELKILNIIERVGSDKKGEWKIIF